MGLFFDKKNLLIGVRIALQSNGFFYQGKVYNKLGLNDKLADLSCFGSLIMNEVHEEFYLVEEKNKFGLMVSNGSEALLEEEPEQTITGMYVFPYCELK